MLGDVSTLIKSQLSRRDLRCDRVIEENIHPSLVDLVDGTPPLQDVSVMSV